MTKLFYVNRRNNLIPCLWLANKIPFHALLECWRHTNKNINKYYFKTFDQDNVKVSKWVFWLRNKIYIYKRTCFCLCVQCKIKQSSTLLSQLSSHTRNIWLAFSWDWRGTPTWMVIYANDETTFIYKKLLDDFDFCDKSFSYQ